MSRAISNAEWTLINNVTVSLVERRADGTYKSFCSGVIIGPGQVATAAHCQIDSLPITNLYLRINDPSRPGRTNLFRAKSFASTENRDGINAVDMGLINFDPRENGAGKVFAQSLRRGHNGCLRNGDYLAAGYGVNNTGDTGEFNINIYSKTEPAEEHDQLFLAKSKAGRICSGDSGGPIFCRGAGGPQFVGVTSAITGRVNATLMPGLDRSYFCRQFNLSIHQKIEEGMQKLSDTFTEEAVLPREDRSPAPARNAEAVSHD
ncbi:MAG: trypsin-like serine protease [Bdellovibrionales bacterium]|nr:trypsin-like serine protease [Bdellovibrionales bacterium]